MDCPKNHVQTKKSCAKKNLNELINVRPERVSNCVCILYCVYTVCILCAFDKQNIDDNNHNNNNKPFERLIAVTPERMSKCVCILYCVYTVCILPYSYTANKRPTVPASNADTLFFKKKLKKNL